MLETIRLSEWEMKDLRERQIAWILDIFDDPDSYYWDDTDEAMVSPAEAIASMRHEVGLLAKLGCSQWGFEHDVLGAISTFEMARWAKYAGLADADEGDYFMRTSFKPDW